MKAQTQVLIIGGGIAGCSLLYHLTRLGVGDCVLVEKQELTAGTTWHSAACVTHFSHSSFISGLHHRTTRMYEALERETGTADRISSDRQHPAGIERGPAGGDPAVRGLREATRHPVRACSAPKKVRTLHPLVSLDGVRGALHTPADGWVDAHQSTHAFAHGARRGGAEIYRHTRVTGLGRRSGGDWEVETDRGTIVAGTVVNAAGFWGNEIAAMAGVSLPLVAVELSYLVTDGIPEIRGAGSGAARAARSGRLVLPAPGARRDADRRLRGPARVLERGRHPRGLWSGVPAGGPGAHRGKRDGGHGSRAGARRGRHQEPDLRARSAHPGLSTDCWVPCPVVPTCSPASGSWPGSPRRPRSGRRRRGGSSRAGRTSTCGRTTFAGSGRTRIAATTMAQGRGGVHVRIPRGLPGPRSRGRQAPKEEPDPRAARRPGGGLPGLQRVGTPPHVRIRRLGGGGRRPRSAHPPGSSGWARSASRFTAARACSIEPPPQSSRSRAPAPRNSSTDWARAPCRRMPATSARSLMLNPSGGIECCFDVTRLAHDRFHLSAPAAAEVHHLDWLRRHGTSDRRSCRIDNVTGRDGILLLVGPRSPDILGRARRRQPGRPAPSTEHRARHRTGVRPSAGAQRRRARRNRLGASPSSRRPGGPLRRPDGGRRGTSALRTSVLGRRTHCVSRWACRGGSTS